MTSLALAIHVLCAVIWVGGMFFAYMALRPAASQLEPGVRLPLWGNTFDRFFPWVWGCIILLPSTGFYLIASMFGGMAGAPLHVHAMQAIGWLMIALFLFVFFRPFRQLKVAIGAKDFPLAGRHLAVIRKLIATNLALGLVVVIAAAAGNG